MNATRQAEDFNALYGVGHPVVVRRDDGTELETKTTFEAAVIGERAVIWVEGIRGCYDLSRVTPVVEYPEERDDERQGDH